MDIASILTPDTLNGILSFTFIGLLITGGAIYLGLVLQQLRPAAEQATLTSPSIALEPTDS